MEKFYFEIPSLEREKDALEYLQEHIDANSKIEGSGGLKRILSDMTYESYVDEVVEKINNDYEITLFTVRESDNKIVGTINFRLVLNDFCKRIAGHIGYGIRPSERGKGYAKIQLYMCLLLANEKNFDKLMISCVSDNEPSARTIKALGGVFERREYQSDRDRHIDVYNIDVENSVNEYKSLYEENISDVNIYKKDKTSEININTL